MMKLARKCQRWSTNRMFSNIPKMPADDLLLDEEVVSQSIDLVTTEESQKYAESDLQKANQFVVKMNSLLLETQILKIREHLEAFKKVAQYSKSKREYARGKELFVNRCKAIFTKYSVQDLADDLEQIDPWLLSTNKLIVPVITDIEKDLEQRHDLNRFFSYTSEVIPKPKYIFNNYEPAYGDDADEKMIKRASHIKFNSPKQKNLQAEASDKVITLERATADSKLSHASTGTNDIEYLDDLNEEKEEEIEGIDTILQRLSDNTLDMYRVFPSSTVVGNSLSTAAERLQQDNQLMIFEQVGFDANKTEETNFIYLLGLPYDLTTKTNQTLKYEIAEALASIGEVKSVKMYSYKDFLNVVNSSKQIPIPKDVANYFDIPALGFADMAVTRRESMPWTEDVYQPDSLEMMAEDDTLLELKEPLLFSHHHNSIKLPTPAKENRKLFKQSARIMSSIELAQWNRLRKSYALVEVKDAETKMNFLREDLRVLGILVNGYQCLLEDADHKHSLLIYQVPYGIETYDFVDSMNQLLSPLNIQLQRPPEESKLMVKSKAIIRFNCLKDLLAAQQLIHDASIESNHLKANILHSNLKCFGGKYYELLDFATKDAYNKRLSELRDRELMFIQQLESTNGYGSAVSVDWRQDENVYDEFEKNQLIDDQTKADFEKAIQYIQDSTSRMKKGDSDLEEPIVDIVDDISDTELN